MRLLFKTSFVVKISLVIAICLGAIASSRKPVTAEPSYGTSAAPAIVGVSQSSILEPAAPLGAPVIGPTVPPPATGIPDLLGPPVGPYAPGAGGMDDFSYGDETGLTGPLFIEFSTGPGFGGVPTTGHPGAPLPPVPLLSVCQEAAIVAVCVPPGDGATNSDIFSNWPAPLFGPPPCGPIGTNIQLLDGNGALVAPFGPRFGLNLPEPGSNLDAYDRGDDAIVGGPAIVPTGPIFFTINAATPWPGPPIFNPFGPPAVPGPSDVIVYNPGLPGFQIFALAAMLGLVPGDDVDALAVTYSGSPLLGGFPAGPNVIFFSLAPGSTSLSLTSGGAGGPAAHVCGVAGTATAGDLWFAPGPVGIGGELPYIDAEQLGLSTVRSGGGPDDNVDAIDMCTDSSAINSDSERLGLGSMDRTNPHEDHRDSAGAAAPRKDTCDLDADNDGLSNGAEIALGTCPGKSFVALPQCHVGGLLINPIIPDTTDTDGDTITDWAEVAQGSDPLNPASRACTIGAVFCMDSDGDGAPDGIEAIVGSNPAVKDTDGDGLNDGIEIMHRATSPTLVNTDGGSCDDRMEMIGLDGNGKVAFGDLLILASSYNSAGPGYPPKPNPSWDANIDYNGDGNVGFADLLMLALVYNMDCGLGDLTP